MGVAGLGLGFAGVGWLGESLIKELPSFDDRLCLAGVQDANANLAADVADRYQAPWHGTDYATLLAAPDVDAVVICTPNALHVPQALAALQAGKHVLVQKPLATSAADARRAVQAAAASDRLLFVDYSYRFLDTVHTLAQAATRIGPIQSASATFHNIYGPGKGWFFDPALSGGGALVDLGVHLLDLALALLHPAHVQLERADLSHAAGHAVEDAAEQRLRLDAVPFDLSVSWNAPRPLTEISFELRGERGTARWQNVEGSFFRFRTLLDGTPLLERETTLRADTLRAFVAALDDPRSAPAIDPRVYDLLDAAYGRA